MLFAIRDDDTSFFTKPEELEGMYGPVWDECPISLAVIPFDVPTYHRGVPEKFYQEGDPVPLSENGALVGFLKKGIGQGRLHVMLHGYNHRYQVTKNVPYDPQYWIPEFACMTDPEGKMRAGKKEIETSVGVQITEFVPPSNTLSAASLNALARTTLNLACATSGRVLGAASLLNIPLYYWHRLSPRYPFMVQRYFGHKQIVCHSLTPGCDWDALRKGLESCGRHDGAFVVSTHYWELQRNHSRQGCTLRALLDELLALARSLGARFSTVRTILSGAAPRA